MTTTLRTNESKIVRKSEVGSNSQTSPKERVQSKTMKYKIKFYINRVDLNY